MFRIAYRLSSLVTFAMFASCAEESITAPPSPLACYELTLGAWSGELPESLAAPPSALQLSDSLGTQILEDGRRVVLSTPKAYPFQYWEPREGGDVLVVFSNGFTGMVMDLAPSGDNLSGTARAFFDFGTFDLTAPVQLDRRACS